MTGTDLVWGLLFGSIGIGYLTYGRRQRAVLPFLCGIGLIAVPYLVSGAILTVGVGLALLVLPFVVKP